MHLSRVLKNNNKKEIWPLLKVCNQGAVGKNIQISNLAFSKKLDKVVFFFFLLCQLCLLNMTKYNFTDWRTETVKGAAEAKPPLEMLSPGVALLCCTFNCRSSDSWRFRQTEIFGNWWKYTVGYEADGRYSHAEWEGKSGGVKAIRMRHK